MNIFSLKKIIPILFLVTILFSQVGYYLISIVQQHLTKEAMEEHILANIPENCLTVFNAEANNIIWEEEGKEFSINGELYDVAKTRIINGKTFLYCISDSKEEQVLLDRSNAVKSGTDQNANSNKQSSHSVKFQLSDYLFTGIEKSTGITQPASHEYSDFTVAIVSSVKKVITPPPNFNLLQNFILWVNFPFL